jgi:hypothetical protein
MSLLALAAYAFLAASPEAPTTPLSTHFPAPRGYERADAPPGSFAAWLRDLPVRTDRDTVLAYDGAALARPSAAIVALDVSPVDLQQCADTVLRLHAEWLWDAGRADEAAYHFTSGDRSAWLDWADGERFVVRGAAVERVRFGARDRSRRGFRTWLDHLFTYAGTRSLPFDTVAASGPFRAGDVFVDPGSPGHAVIVLDIAESAGGPVALLGQGFMPAEDLHVLRDPDWLGGVWMPIPTDGPIATPSWRPFEPGHRRRFPDTDLPPPAP